MELKTALISGIVRDQVASDPWGTLEYVARIGYKGVEIGNTLSSVFKENLAASKRRPSDIGLETFSFGTVLNSGTGT